MKIFFCVICMLVSGALFLPHGGSTQIRNLPLLITIICLALAALTVKAIKYICLMMRVKRILDKKGFRAEGIAFVPFIPILRFRRKSERLNVAFVVVKRRYRHYYFKDEDHIEYYRSSRMVVRNAGSVTVSRSVDTKLVGKRRITWGRFAEDPLSQTVLLFDKLPYKVTDSAKSQELGNGDKLCTANILLYDLEGFLKHYGEV